MLANSSYASIANRVSYCFDLDGPSLAIDSMCSSSLTTIHLACQLLRAGGCHIAIAGGVNLSLHPYKYRMLCDMKFAATDGKCRSFGEGGDGYVPGEGVGALILRPLADAIADDNHIYAVIKGSDIGHGGRTSGYTVPNADAQSEVIRTAFQQSGLPTERCSYIEAHGTGTSLGDPIELRGLEKAFGRKAVEISKCAIGSVKSNVGHLESASGVAGITKVLLQLKHDQLAPSIHSGTINTNIDFSRTPFMLQRELAPWVSQDGLPRVAGISSMGAGGANAHVVLEEFIAQPSRVPAAHEPRLFIFSSQSQGQLTDTLATILARFNRELRPDGLLGKEGFCAEDVANTLRFGRRHFPSRLAILASTLKDLTSALDKYLTRTAVRPAEATDRVIFSCVENAQAADLAEQARAWVRGEVLAGPVAMGWRRVPLPGYTFLKRRYWVAMEQAIARRMLASEPEPQLSPQMIVNRVANGELTDAEARALLRNYV